MSKTLGRWEQQTPFSDGQLFVPFTQFIGPNNATTSGGLIYNAILASTTTALSAALSTLFRTGQLATAAQSQEYYGTAANAPGPSSVAGTTDPLALPPGFPPWLNSVNPALTGGNANAGVKGAIPKGLQINSVDVIYGVDVLAMTSVQFGLVNVKFPSVGVAAIPVQTNLITFAANGLPTAVNTANFVYRTRIAVPTPAFSYIDGTEIVAQIAFTTPATSVGRFYGLIFNSSFNYN